MMCPYCDKPKLIAHRASCAGAMLFVAMLTISLNGCMR